jgi:plastocyanin
MKLDITKLPVLEGVIGFLLVVTILTFVGAFAAVNGEDEGEEEPAVETPAGTPAPDGSTLTVTMVDNAFEPDQFVVAAGAGVIFDLTNDGAAIHNMHIAGPDGSYESDVDVSDPDQVSGGETATLEWTAPAEAGEIDFQCDFHPGQMVGTITVQ